MDSCPSCLSSVSLRYILGAVSSFYNFLHVYGGWEREGEVLLLAWYGSVVYGTLTLLSFSSFPRCRALSHAVFVGLFLLVWRSL